MPNLTLKAPLSGVIYPIEEVPDPVFSQKMVGDGISIDPSSNILYAPVDGTVAQLHNALHAVTLTHSSGLEIMIHIGLDTVALKSKGFEAHIEEGQQVKAGEPLITFDMDYIATHAKSLMTQVVLMNDELIDSIEKSEGTAIANESILMRVTLKEHQIPQESAISFKKSNSEPIIIPNTTGLHARPAAVLAALAKKYEAEIRLCKGERTANAKSVVSIMGLDIGYRDEVCLNASGSDAEEAVAEIVPQIQNGLGDEGIKPVLSAAAVDRVNDREPEAAPRSSDPDTLMGLSASPGITVGTAVRIEEETFVFEEEASNPYEEKIRLDRAIEESKNQLEALIESMHREKNASRAAILDAHRELLDDPELIDMARSMIDKGKSAEYGWRHACDNYAKQLEKLHNKLLAERANDLRDVEKRVLRVLIGKEPESPELPENAIVIAEELAPSFIAGIDTGRIKGFCTTTGGTTSHAAIIARSLDIPAITGIETRVLEIADGTVLILDGGRGTLKINPSDKLIEETETEQRILREEKERNFEAAMEPAITRDGKKVEVAANIGGVNDAIESVRLGGEGVGLLRSEFLFLDRLSAPSEEEQYRVYCNILEALDGRPLLVRTLDVGGDKPLPYLPMPEEENPFLGQRGIRIGLEKPEIFRTQARAILRAGMQGKIRMMFPMISTIDEIREAKGMLEQERKKLGAEPVETGIMVEVPSTALLAEHFAREVDFFSIGTNDLTQYTLAMDRGHPKLAAKIDALDPAVLQLIKLTADGAHREGKWVGVCGGLASDPMAVPILLGLDIDELSVAVPTIPDIKAEVRKYRYTECQTLAREALECASSLEVRELLQSKRGGEQ